MGSSFSKYFVVGLNFLLMLASCATPQFQAEEQSCTALWMQKIPPRLTQQLVTRTNAVQVPNGQFSCTYIGYMQNCTQGMTTQYIPYTAVETVDLMASSRNPNIQSCTAKACEKKYGNPECEVN